MQIAPGVDASVWHALRLDDPHSPDWDKAVNILSARIQDRYIAPVDFLVTAEQNKPPSERRFGFTVLAIDCLLVETLGAFVEGLEDTDGISKKTFCTFVRGRKQFATEFATDDLAARFYQQFRCGILHQAETRGDSKVWSVGPMLRVNGDAITVNRNKFHESIKAEFETYLAELRDPQNSTLRANFRKKMNFVSRL